MWAALVGDVTNLSAEESRRRQQREINNSLKVEAWNEYTFLGCVIQLGQVMPYFFTHDVNYKFTVALF